MYRFMYFVPFLHADASYDQELNKKNTKTDAT